MDSLNLPEIDLVELRKKYAHERDLRLRSEGIGQFVELEGDYRRYIEDPDEENFEPRATLDDDVDVLVIGSGWSGILAAVRLVQAGIKNIRIVDNGGDFGGTWYWNRYPGVQCDLESYIYIPLLEETNYVPREKYSYGEEIQGHAQRVGRQFGLYERALFRTKVDVLTWDDAAARWRVQTNRGDSFTAKHVIMSCGHLNRPKLPGIPGILDFKGKSFHTSRWDYDYTGGDTNGNLTGLRDKRVALIGTGATGIQVAPFIADDARHLYVVQRTPVAVAERGNRPTDPEWASALKPGWQEERRANFHKLVTGVPQDRDLVNDGWTAIMSVLGAIAFRVSQDASKTPEERATEMELADAHHMNYLRTRVESSVESDAVAESLKPWYRFFCKRPTFNDRYLPMFNRDNVTLLDTHGRGVERVTENGIVVDGREYEIDCLIFATGFEVGTEYARRAEIEVRGRDGLQLIDHWADDFRTLHGVTSNGFPNLYFIGPSQGPGDVNALYPTETQTQYITRILRRAFEEKADVVEPTEEAVQGYVSHFHDMAIDNLEFYRQCTPGYYNNEGNPSKYKGYLSQRYGGGLVKYRAMVMDWLEAGMPGLQFRKRS